MTTRVMFVNAINPNSDVQQRYQPVSMAYLASSLRCEFGQEYFRFKIIDRDFNKELKEFNPDIVGITSVSQNYNIAKSYARLAKESGVPVIVGGTHITAMPGSLTPYMDVGIVGEGERTVVELFTLFENDGSFANTSKLERIPGLVYRKNGKISLTKPGEMICPLDDILLPARDLITIKETTYIFSSRGCPYRCEFCFSSRFWNKVRFFSAKYVIREIKELIDLYKVKHIGFYDDLFIANRKRLRDLVTLIRGEGLDKKVSFSCSARADLVNDEVARLLKEMNVLFVSMGLESGCNRTLRYLKGPGISVEDNLNAVRTLKWFGIGAEGSFIIGSPQETREEILETLDFIKEADLHSFDVYLLTPLPGTPIWRLAKEKGLVSDNMDWDALNINFLENQEKSIIISETLSRTELYELFMLFETIRRKKVRKILTRSLIQQGFQKPYKVPGFLLRQVRKRLTAVTRRPNNW